MPFNNWVSYGSCVTAVNTGQRNNSLVSSSDNNYKKDWTAPDMKMSKVGNQTNSQDPQAVNSRVFVGNLNTYYCTKTDVERMFQRYGRLAGISMHKGYAFVQYTNPFDARGACLGEDGRTILGQTLDVNMVSEPKPHQTGRKRQNVAKTGNDWDYYYDREDEENMNSRKRSGVCESGKVGFENTKEGDDDTTKNSDEDLGQQESGDNCTETT